MELARPYAQRLLTNKINPFRQSQELFYWLADALDVARDLPYDIGILLRELRKGRLKIEFEHIGIEPIRRTIEKVLNRMSLTIIIASLLISSSVVVLAKVPPLVANIPLIAFVGYIVAILLAIVLAFNIWFRSH